MKKITILIILALTSVWLSGCLPLNPTPVSQSASEKKIKTAVAATLAAERAKEAGAQLMFTETPDSGTPDLGTPEVEETSESAEGTDEGEEDGEESAEDPAPEPDNPWMLQSWCEDHVGCMNYDLRNRTDSWLQVELKETDTGVTGFFSIKSKTTASITLIPGMYDVQYTWWCDGDAKSFSEVKSLGSFIDVFKCPQGFYQRLDKQ